MVEGNMVRIVVFRPGADKVVIEKVRDNLSTYQNLVGGLVEDVHVAPNLDLWCNEEGIRLRLPPNTLATMFMGRLIVGTAVLLRGDNEGQIVDLTDADIKMVEEGTGHLRAQMALKMRKE